MTADAEGAGTVSEAPGRAGGPAGGGEGEKHASNRTYLAVAAVLAVLTALEVMVFYVPALKGVLVPILLTLMTAKFSLVVLFFMHLRHDPSVLSGVFGGALVVAVALILAMLALYGKLLGGGSEATPEEALAAPRSGAVRVAAGEVRDDEPAAAAGAEAVPAPGTARRKRARALTR